MIDVVEVRKWAVMQVMVMLSGYPITEDAMIERARKLEAYVLGPHYVSLVPTDGAPPQAGD